MEKELKIIECPRDAMQGMLDFVPTEKKATYINQLLLCGFDTIDFGSFVSPKAIPQMRDTAEVLSQLDLTSTKSKLLAIIANERGAEDACSFEEINYLGYPFSVSEEFQKRNTNSTIEETLHRVEFIQNNCILSNKKLVLYLSMGFGNPYGEKWSPELVLNWTERLVKLFGIEIIAPYAIGLEGLGISLIAKRLRDSLEAFEVILTLSVSILVPPLESVITLSSSVITVITSFVPSGLVLSVTVVFFFFFSSFFSL